MLQQSIPALPANSHIVLPHNIRPTIRPTNQIYSFSARTALPVTRNLKQISEILKIVEYIRNIPINYYQNEFNLYIFHSPTPSNGQTPPHPPPQTVSCCDADIISFFFPNALSSFSSHITLSVYKLKN